MIGHIKTGFLSASLSGFLAIASPSGARSDDTETQRERSVDLTGSYQELGFTGSIQIRESGGEYLYELPALTFRFLDTYRPFPTSIRLEELRVVVVAPGTASKPKALSGYLLERTYPLPASLSSSAREFTRRRSNSQFRRD